jgi:hypothetical protein
MKLPRSAPSEIHNSSDAADTPQPLAQVENLQECFGGSDGRARTTCSKLVAPVLDRSRLLSFLSSNRASWVSNLQEAIAVENKMQPTPSHEDRKAQTLMKRIEKTQSSQEAAKAAETTRTLADYGKKVGS